MSTYTYFDSGTKKHIKVLHFASGGFSGATKIASDLTSSTIGSCTLVSILVLRRKRGADINRVLDLRQQGVVVETVVGFSNLLTVLNLMALCIYYKPDILVSHGFSEHLWGRYSGLFAGVKHLVHVEHNSRERYTPFRLVQAHFLARFTDAIVGCSLGVSERLRSLGFPREKIVTINNGANLDPFIDQMPGPLDTRILGIVMPARFSKQKDHLTLIRALALLKSRGITLPVILAGSGSQRHLSRVKKLVRHLKLEEHVEFLGYSSNLPGVLMNYQFCVLSTHYEGMPIALIEGMAAGCVVIGSDVIGVREMINHNIDGLLVKPRSPDSLADALELAITNTAHSQILANRARARALTDFSISRMADEYKKLFVRLMGKDCSV